MRSAFVAQLLKLALRDDRVMLLTGDLGFLVVEEFAAAKPDRFLNVGVAEANLIGVATGLAAQGFLPFCYSIGTFASLRAYDQIRNGPIVHQLPVRIVGVGGGYGYGTAGSTHHALEDLGVMRLQPGLTVLAPIDDRQTELALTATYDLPGPIYYRLGKDRLAVLPDQSEFRLGRVEFLGSGADVLLVTCGSLSAAVLAAADHLSAVGVGAQVALVATISPPPEADLAPRLKDFGLIVTVEDHYTTGGLGSLVAEMLAASGAGPRLLRLGAGPCLGVGTGSESYLLREAGLTPEAITASILAARRGPDRR